MQSAYMGKLMELAEKDRDVLHVLSDSGTGYDEMYRLNFPDQILNFGIAEEHAVAAAAGMATAGKIPFVYTAGAFLAYRALEFIRDDLCFQNLNVKVVGMGSGLSWSSLGPTHHTTEDVAVLRSMPNLTILSPATPNQVAGAVEDAYAIKGPVYIRIGMNHEKEYFEPVSIREGYNLIKGGDSGAIITTGSILEEVIEAATSLAARGKDLTVVNITSIKPFNTEKIWEIIKNKKDIFTVEEHSVMGGLGSMVSEIITEKGAPIRVHKIGIEDTFAVGYGTHNEVRKANGLDRISIENKIYETLIK